MTENDEKLAKRLAEEYRGQDHNSTGHCKMRGFYNGFLAGIAHERARAQKIIELAKQAILFHQNLLDAETTKALAQLDVEIKEYESGAE